MKKDEETVREIREKIWEQSLDKTKIWGKTYLRVIIADTESSTWTYDDEKVQVEVDEDGHLCVQDDNKWIFVTNKKALEIIREAIDVAIRKQDEAI